jgi:hypothetical protein
MAAELGDFEVALGQNFLSGSAPFSTTFNTALRNAGRRAVLHLQAFGGFLNTTTESINLRVKVNGTTLGVYTVHRWLDHAFIVMDSLLIEFSSNLLNSGNNTLTIEPLYSGTTDYCWVGPGVVQFRQNS